MKKSKILVMLCILTVFYMILREFIETSGDFRRFGLKQKTKIIQEVKVSGSYHNFTMVYRKREKKNSTIYALFWSHYLTVKDWYHHTEPMDQNHLKKLNCPQTDCVLTHNVDLLPNILDYDAVIFNLYQHDIPFPEIRSPHQLYIMTSNELKKNLKKVLK
jgi:hypothetical protein